MLTVDVQRESSLEAPEDDSFETAAALALRVAGRAPTRPTEVSLRIIDEAEQLPVHLLGDIAICAPVVLREADQQGKAHRAHWDHMTIHGVLHLLGFDHEDESEAEHMEGLEARALHELGWPNPYGGDMRSREAVEAGR